MGSLDIEAYAILHEALIRCELSLKRIQPLMLPVSNTECLPGSAEKKQTKLCIRLTGISKRIWKYVKFHQELGTIISEFYHWE